MSNLECFPSLCTVVANLSNVTRTPYQGPHGIYYIQLYNVVLMCGQTELKAQIRWKKNGKEMRGPASIVYDDLLESSAR
ncbi:hypothetical protein C8Q79DRAFT_182515 [Trametes meyenii]|nr:hypothetical protein C8Q79DRAFT_182515 [Trametes meyenii]